MFSISRFGELLQNFPTATFQKSVADSKADRYVKSFSSKDLLNLMIYGQIQQVSSLRELISGFNVHNNHHYHLGTQTVKRSTVSDALTQRSMTPFKAACDALMAVVSRQHRKQLKSLICLIDSTPIELRHQRFSWAEATRTPTTQGLKVHLAIDAKSTAPMFHQITRSNVSDLTAIYDMPLKPDTTYVFDKGYCNYQWWYDIDQAHAHFVTRLKSNARYEVKEEQVIGNDSPILRDQRIHLTNRHPGGGRVNPYADKDLRRIEVAREDKETPLVIVTNDFARSAQELANLYKQRWGIELLFKWLKQKLKLKTFFGNSENAIRIQLYGALISYLLILLLHKNSEHPGGLSSLAIELQHGLFQRRETLYQHYRRRKEERDQAARGQLVMAL